MELFNKHTGQTLYVKEPSSCSPEELIDILIHNETEAFSDPELKNSLGKVSLDALDQPPVEQQAKESVDKVDASIKAVDTYLFQTRGVPRSQAAPMALLAILTYTTLVKVNMQLDPSNKLHQEFIMLMPVAQRLGEALNADPSWIEAISKVIVS